MYNCQNKARIERNKYAQQRFLERPEKVNVLAKDLAMIKVSYL